ncbi:hypothetical protein CASFOL_036683 [Castilleja foliolosa]|uniref:Uncharacterized protein n=1 Tax=Castilleja foliolosa TaxID=1961234 RepID=A0ABD3BPH0_9LAMI
MSMATVRVLQLILIAVFMVSTVLPSPKMLGQGVEASKLPGPAAPPPNTCENITNCQNNKTMCQVANCGGCVKSKHLKHVCLLGNL